MSLSFFVSSGQALSEDFEGTSTPDYVSDDWVLTSGTWKVFDNGIGTVQHWQPYTITSLVYAGLRSAYVQRENVTDGTLAEDWLVTPSVQVPADGQLRFFTRKAIGTNNGTQYTVRISQASQTNPTDFTVLQTWDDSNINSNQTAPFYEQKVIDLSAYDFAVTGLPVHIAFVMTNDNGNRWLVDNVFVDQRCQESTNLFVTSVNDTSVDLNWDNPSGATQWEVEWGPTGFTPGTGTSVIVNTNPYNLGGLVAATTYDFYVRPICPNDNYGIWAGPETFTTAVCAITQQCDFDFVMTDSFGDGWNGASMTISQFGVPVATIGSTFTGGSGPITVTVPLCSSQPFDLVWTSGGTFPNEVGVSIVDPLGATIFTMPSGSGSQAGTTIYSGVAACTPPTCPQPSNVVVSGVNTSSGTITWSDNTGGVAVPATQWQVIIQPAGSGYPPSGAEIINTTVSSTSYSFSGLNSDTQYEVFISAICDASGTPDPSFYEGPTLFTTSKNYCGGDVFTDSGGSGANYSNGEDIIWTICPDTPGDAVTVFFNTFNTEANWDGLYVFDGPDITAPQIASGNGAGNVPGGVPGSFWGTTIPGPFVSSHPSGCLTFRFRSDGSVNRPGWTANVVCGAPPTCSMPTGLSVSSITSDGATLSWTDTNTPPATGWQIAVQPAGSGYPPTAATTLYTATTNPFTVTGLNPNSTYEFYVQSDCGAADGVSFWGGPFSFNTLFPGCGGSAPASDVCVDATPVCSLDGYCGNTSGTYTDASWPALDTAFCGSIENNSFLTFEAASTSISMNVEVGNCTNGSGIQFMIFSGTCGGAVNTIGCDGSMDPGTNALTFTGLVPGQTYILMIDGFAGAICDYSVTVTSGGSFTTDVTIAQEDQTICIDDTLTIDVTGGNGVYNWDPATGLDTTTGSSVVFTPPAPGVYIINVQTTDTNSLCATADFIEVTVLDNTTPSFSNPGPLCSGSPNVALDTTDSNGITGSWTLGGNPVTEVDASTAGVYDYIFTPDSVAFPCSPAITMQVEILATCTFNAFASAVYVDNCETSDPGEYFNTTGSSTNAFGAATNSFNGNDFGTYVQNSGNFMLQGAAIKTFKNATSNVCGANMYYRVYEVSSAPGAFTAIPLTFVEDCGAGTFTSGAPCVPGDQIWGNSSQTIDLTNFVPGDYILEVYYDVNGDNDAPDQCDDTILVNNGGNNFISNFTIQSAITFAQTNEECGSSNGTIIVSGFNPGDVYTLTYNDDTIPVGPVDYQADFNGQIIITGLDAGTYDNFDFVINGCSIFDATPIIITDFSPAITNVTNNSPICFGNDVVFVIEGTPNFDVDYTINGAPMPAVTIDASGFATVTVTNPAPGTVDLALLNIHNSVCNIVVNNTSSVVVNPLPTATITAPSTFACIGSDAVFTITGTPGAIVSFTGAPGSPITLDATGSYTLNVASTVDVQVTLVDVTNPTTGCVNTILGQVANVAIVEVPIPTANLTQPTCSVPTGVVEVTSPLISQVNFPGDLFISEITDAQPGSLTYVEIYNGTGADVDLSNYKIRVTTNGTTLSCDLPLSGVLVNDDVLVVKLSSSANEGGVVADLSFTTCTGVNNNDRIALSNLSNVDIDVWGTPDGSAFTPSSGIGYNYQRITTGTTLPSTTWDPADWIATDWGNPTATTGDYSNVGFYTLYAANYEYILSDGTTSSTQATPTYTGVVPGTYTLVVHDTATGCYSQPLNIVIDAPPGAVTPTFDQIGPLCQNSTAPSLPASSTNSVTGTWSPATIDTMTIGTTTYTFTPDTGICALIVTMDIEILPQLTPIFNQIGPLCQNSTAPSLPTTSNNGVVGTWSPATIDTSASGISTYTFTSSSACDVVVTMDIEIIPQVTPTFDQIGPICQNTTAPVLPTTSTNGVSGTWSPSTIDTSVAGSTTYTFTPSTVCDVQVTMVIDIDVESPMTFSALTLCVGDNINNVFPSTAGVSGTWSDTTIDTSVAGNYTYTFTPDSGQCLTAGDFDVFVISKTPVTFSSVEACLGASVDFPTVSVEGYTLTGTWNPSSIITTTAGPLDYTFTPDDVCYEQAVFQVVSKSCEIPKGISPDGDAKNDEWDLTGFNVKRVEIFNRYGRKVYSKTDYVDEWHGQSDSGSELPTGTYYYVLEFNDQPSKTGWVYINREE